MQAMQSSTASGSGIYSGKFAALRHVTREMGLHTGSDAGGAAGGCDAGDAAAAIAGVAEGAGLAHDAGNLLGALSLYSDLLAMPGVLHEEHREYAAELRMLSDRSWAMINRLVNHSRAGLPAKVQAEISVLPDVVDRCRGLLSRVAGRTVEVSYGVGAFQPVRVPVEAVERILTNLVKNAAEATPWVGAISIDVEGVMEQAERGCDERTAAGGDDGAGPGLRDGSGGGAAADAVGRDLEREWAGAGLSRGAGVGGDLGWVSEYGEPAGGGDEYFCGVVCGEADRGRSCGEDEARAMECESEDGVERRGGVDCMLRTGVGSWT